ncbi:MAG: site-2 protease family protein, partial [Candidatus Magasanikbacteria bacterium]|nr:site-2 protease family protein [Candidatus Magasanikbacteria bacterium]
MLLTLFVFLLLLSVLVLIHEFGHFIVAKKLGIKVEEFGWGFPPKIWGKKIGETEYTINALPFGGFVKLYGEDDAGGGKVGSSKVTGSGAKDVKRAFFARSKSQRAAVVLAGVIMNVLLAFVIFYLYFAISGFRSTLPLLTDHRFTNVNQTNYNLNATDTIVSFTVPESPAGNLGMNLPADITEINGEEITDRTALINIVNENRGKEISVGWTELMTGEAKTGKITPRQNPPENEGALGVAFFPVAYLQYESFSQKAFAGVTYSYDIMAYTISVMKQLVSVSVETGDPAPVGEAVSGPVG